MRVITPGIDVWFHMPQHITEAATNNTVDPTVFLEQAGRLCYKSEDKITNDSAAAFVKMLTKRGHGAMLEHCVASVKFICDRGVTHEMVRHRLASFAQESTRYCSYNKDKFDNQIAVVEPPFLQEGSRKIWEEAVKKAEACYMGLIKAGEPPQLARSVLPISLKTEIWMTCNLREWQHVFSLRCAKAAHPQIRDLMLKTLAVFRRVVPAMFEQQAALFDKENK